MLDKAVNETHALLRAYAASTGSLTVAGTVRQFTDWYRFLHGIDIPERTFQRHTRQLADAGLISVRHTKRRTWYTLLTDEIKVPVYSTAPTGEPGVSDIVQVGYEILRHEPVEEAGISIRDFDDIDLDALQASWPNAGSHAAKGTVIAIQDPPSATCENGQSWDRAAGVSDAA